MHQLVLLLTLCKRNLKLPSFGKESEEKSLSLSLCQVTFLPLAKPSHRLIHSSFHSFERKTPPHLSRLVFTHGLHRSLKKMSRN